MRYFIRSAFIAVLVFSMLVPGMGHAAKELDWFVYRDAKYGYTIQYPSNWVRQSSLPGQPDWYIASDALTSKKGVTVPLTIIIAAGPDTTKPGGTLSDYAMQTREEILIPIGKAGLRKNFEGMKQWPKMNGVRVIGWGTQQEKVRGYGASFIKDKVAYTIAYLTDDKDVANERLKTHLQRSLASFRFPGPQPREKTKKFESKSFGVSLIYPSAWEVRDFPSQSVVFTDPKADSVAGLRANASVALYVIPKSAPMQSIIASFTKQAQKGTYDFKIIEQPRFVSFKEYTAGDKRAAEMIATFRVSNREGTPLMRSHFLFLSLPDRSIAIHDRGFDTLYKNRKAAFDAIMKSLTVLPKK